MDGLSGEARQAGLGGRLVEGSVGGTNGNVADPSLARSNVDVAAVADAVVIAADDVIADQVQPFLARESNLGRRVALAVQPDVGASQWNRRVEAF